MEQASSLKANDTTPEDQGNGSPLGAETVVRHHNWWRSNRQTRARRGTGRSGNRQVLEIGGQKSGIEGWQVYQGADSKVRSGTKWVGARQTSWKNSAGESYMIHRTIWQ